MNQQDRTRIQRLCTELRASSWPTWDSAGVEAAILELDRRMPTDPLGVAIRALTAAREPGNRGPAAMLAEKPAVSMAAAPPAAQRPPCPVHGGKTWNTVEDMYACCWVERQQERGGRPVSPVAAGRRCGPPPPEVKAAIEALRARSVVGSGGSDVVDGVVG